MSGEVVAIPVRRTQEERSASTRTRLLDATIECLSELGYAATTTTEIAQRAGVSRGAQLHHFPTKAELVTTAVEHLFHRRTEEFRAAFAALPAGANKPAAAIDILWSMFTGPTFFAWLELMVAARTDANLRGQVAGMAQRFGDTVQNTFHELFTERSGAATDDPTPAFAFALLQGTALESIVFEDQSRLLRNLDVLKTLAAVAEQLRPSRKEE